MLIASLSVAFVAYCARLSYGMLLPSMMQDLGLNHAQAGLIYSSYAAAYMMASPIVGFLVDVRDLRRVVLAFLPLMAAGTALMAVASSLWTAIVFFGIAGAGASVGWTPLVTWVQRAYAERRGTYLGALSVSTTLGIGVMGLAMPWILPVTGWRGIWGILGLASAACIPIVWSAKDFTRPPNAIPFRRYAKEFARVLREGAFWLSGGSYMAATFAVITPLTFSADYAKYLGAGTTWEGWIFAVIGFTSIAGLAIPALSDRRGRKRSLALNDALRAAGLAGSALAGSIRSLAAWTAVIAVSYGGVWALYAALVRDMFGGGLAGGTMGAWVVMGSLGFLLSPLVSGFLIDATGSYVAPYLLSAAMALASILLAFAASGSTN